MEDHNPVCNGMSDLFGHTMQHAAISQLIMERFSSVNWTPAYNLCLRAGCKVMDVNLEIPGLFTMTLSAPESLNHKSQAGTLSLGF